MRTSNVTQMRAIIELSVGITNKKKLWINGFLVDRPLLKIDKNGHFYIKETDTG